MQFDVDAVITWVDGNDPSHRQKLDNYLQASGEGSKAAAKPTRFNDCGELEYCVGSLLRFAPWLRTIYIVSDQQTPAFMAELKNSPYAERVRIVDHRDIFTGFEQHLPTFSNRSIECMLWRIPGLAERFIYLNDDFQLIRPSVVDDFFRDDKIVLRGAWQKSREQRWAYRVKNLLSGLPGLNKALANTRPGNHAAQNLSARLAGFTSKYFQASHLPYPMQKSVLADFFSLHPELLSRNVAFRLRSPEQFISTGLAVHLALAQNRAIIDNRLTTIRLNPASKTQSPSALNRQLREIDTEKNLAFSCVQSLDKADNEARELIVAWFNRRIGKLSEIISSNTVASTGNSVS